MATFKKLSDREHMLERPNMYIGKVTTECSSRYIDGKITNVSVVPGLLKIIYELIDNSIDEHIRSGYTAATKISISCSSTEITITDNGRGIPVELYNGTPRPEVAWTEAKAGTSFESERIGIGANGVGSVVANVFSTSFLGITSDGKNVCTVRCSDNMKNINTSIKNSKKKPGTSVTIHPDFRRFGITELEPDYFAIIRDRIRLLSVTYPKIEFMFNNEKIKYKNPDSYFEQYGTVYHKFTRAHFVAAIYPSDLEEYTHRTAIDGLDMPQGGTHEQILSREIASALRELIKKKHKLEMTLPEIKRGIKLVLMGTEFPNMEFESQTKEKLTNSEKMTKEWLGEIRYDVIAKKLFGIPEFIDPIIESKLAKQIAAEKRAVTLAQKGQAKRHIEKHLEAKSKDVKKKTIFICEGDSAAGLGIKVRDPQFHGFFPIRGMPMNTYDAKEKDILENKELSNIMAILGLKFNQNGTEINKSIQYGRIGILTDADTDGTGGITPLLLSFFYHWKDLFSQNRIYIIPSPRYVLTKGKGKSRTVKYFYDTQSYEAEKSKYKGYEVRYIKGLATLRDYEYSDVIHKEENWIRVEIDNPDAFRIMYSDNVEERKKLMSE